MLERSKPILRLACIVLAALVIYEVADVVLRINPLARVKLPELPSLPPDTNAPPAGRPANAAQISAMANGTNNPPRRGGTNAAITSVATGTNVATNMVTAATNVAGTNAASSRTSTNAETQVATLTTFVSGASNTAALRVVALTNTNAVAVLAGPVKGTNSAQSAGTNAVSAGAMTSVAGRAGGPRAAMMAGGPNLGPGMAGGRRGVELPPAIQARVDRIAESEILGTVMRPPPMALLGIAGNYAILRTPTGQVGLVKEGDELGGVKLLTIGTNRVLVEEQAQKKELTIFSGFGGESLLPKQETPK